MELLISFVNDVCLFPKQKLRSIGPVNGQLYDNMRANQLHSIGPNYLDFTIRLPLFIKNKRNESKRKNIKFKFWKITAAN